ncbi:MAG: 3-keto-5-aminohexanoate cleavage protein [Myxococcales bacterium]|nr:3-keto-5-aminohexanoate cleavage protein [Myxococcales bacterium]
MDRVIITCALTGVLADRRHCPWVPYTPEEIAEEARRAFEAGASVVHIHARDPDTGGPAYGADVYRSIAREVRRRCPVILNFSTGSIGLGLEEKVAPLREVRPDLAAVNMGSMNYAKYNERKKQFVFELVFENSLPEIRKILEVMNASDVKPELECFDAGHTASVGPLVDMGLLRAPLSYSFIHGVVGGMPASVEALAFQARLVPQHASWTVISIGMSQWKMVGGALSLGGHVRVGLEDNFYLTRGQMAQSNGELVEKAVRMARDIGREPVAVEEARAMLGLGPMRDVQ